MSGTQRVRVRCGKCTQTRSGQCLTCELVEITVDRERLRLENATLTEKLALRDETITKLSDRIGSLSAGIAIRGWWCMPCDSFNGEEQSLRFECRSCGRPKAVRP